MRRILFGLLIVLLIALTSATWYAYDKGFTKKWRGFVSDEFRKAGVEVSLRRLTLDPFRGLVAKNVKIFDARDRRRVLAQIDEVNLGINYANALRGQPFLEFVDLRDTSLALPLNSRNPRGPRIEVSRLNARLFLPPHQIYLARAEAEIHGMRISATGRLINPQSLPKTSDGRTAPAEFINQAIEQLKAIKPEGAPPVLTVQFSGDLAKPKEIFADIRLSGSALRRRNYRLESLEAALSVRNGTLELQRLHATDAHGELHARGAFEPATHKATLQLRSNLDLKELTRAFDILPQLGEFAFHDPPALDLTVEGMLGDAPRLHLLGRATLGRFAFRSVAFGSFAASFSSDDQRWFVRDVRLIHQSGTVQGDAMQVPGEFRARFRSTADPGAMLPLLGDKAPDWLNRVNFSDSPEFTIELQGSSPRSVSGTMRLIAGGGSLFTLPPLSPFPRFLHSLAPGVGANGATETSAAFTFRNNVVAMDDLTIEGAGFLMTGKGWLSPADDRLAFSMRVQARGAPGGTTPLPGRLQAYVAEGKFSEPLWVLKAEE